jgi:hypothetical protein
MKTILKFAVAGAALASAAAHATVALPTDTGGGDLMLFVQDTAVANTVYARDTGISVDSLFPASAAVPGASYTGPIAKTLAAGAVNVTADANLTAFLSAHAADLAAGKIQWAVEAGSYSGALLPGALQAPGAARFLTTTSLDISHVTQVGSSQLANSYVNLTADMNLLNAFGGAGATAIGSAKSTVATGDGIWGTANGTSGNQNWYGAGPDTTATLMSSTGATAQAFYGLTGGGKSKPGEVFTFGQLQLSSDGTLSNVTSVSPVPLPAAVWLFGSGLLGLVGVGRRRSVSAV